MTIQNKTMLITYSDSLGKNLKELNENLGKYFGEAVGGVHLLPFFPSTGDRGFAPVDYDEVDAAFGDWDDVKALGEKYYLMFDFMINHISAKSPYFLDFLEKKDDPPMRQGETEGREGIMGYRSHRMRRETDETIR